MDREAVEDFLRTADAVLDDDWTVSEDAMRWTPAEDRDAPLELTSLASSIPVRRSEMLSAGEPEPRPVPAEHQLYIAAMQDALERLWAQAEIPADPQRLFFFNAPQSAEIFSPTVERYARMFREGVERIQRDQAFMDIMRLNEEMRSYADLIPAVPAVEETASVAAYMDGQRQQYGAELSTDTGDRSWDSIIAATASIDPHGHR